MPVFLKATGVIGSVLALIALVVVLVKQIIAFIGIITFAVKALIVLAFVALFLGVALLVFRSMSKNKKGKGSE